MWGYLEDVQKAVEAGAVHRILLFGPPGTGKTSWGAKLASSLGRELFILTLTGDTVVQEIMGHWIPRGAEFVFQEGPAVRAFRTGGVLVLNEVDQASGAVLTALLAILDDKEVARISLPTGETIRPHPGFLVVGTMNATPEEIPVPLRDRFEVAVKVSEPSPEAMSKLSEEIRGPLLESYRALSDGAERLAITYREALAYSRLLEVLNDRSTAAYLVWGSRYLDVLNAISLGVRRRR